MTTTIKQIETLNSANQLTACRVSPTTAPSLVQASLDLTRVLFPYEPTAPDTLGEAYNGLTSGQSRFGECELLDYFIYTLGSQPQNRVVGASGIYRHVDDTVESDTILDILRRNPPASVSFLRNQDHDIADFLWGGRLCIEPHTARSPACMPFIIHHILSTAQGIINAQHLAPALLAFTMRDDNARVKRFYTQLGFENTGASVEYGGRIQDVFALNLSPQSPILTRLSEMMSVAKR